MLPKSLHTVRILTAVAAQNMLSPSTMPASVRVNAVLRAAAIIGYPDVDPCDPLISKAVDGLAKVQS